MTYLNKSNLFVEKIEFYLEIYSGQIKLIFAFIIV